MDVSLNSSLRPGEQDAVIGKAWGVCSLLQLASEIIARRTKGMGTRGFPRGSHGAAEKQNSSPSPHRRGN